MNKKIAMQIADERLDEILSGGKPRILNLLNESEHAFVARHGVEYQLKAYAFYEDKEKKVIRVGVAVDDQRFWSTLLPVGIGAPVNVSELMAGQNSMGQQT